MTINNQVSQNILLPERDTSFAEFSFVFYFHTCIIQPYCHCRKILFWRDTLKATEMLSHVQTSVPTTNNLVNTYVNYIVHLYFCFGILLPDKVYLSYNFLLFNRFLFLQLLGQ